MEKHVEPKHTNAPSETDNIFSSIIQLVHDAIIVVDEDQNIIYFNRGAEKMFGYNASEIIGQQLGLLLPPQATDFHVTFVRNFAKASENARLMSEREEVSAQRKGGEIFPAQASIAKIPHEGKVFFTAILRDITGHKHAEQALRKSEETHRRILNGVDEILYQVSYTDGGPASGTVGFVSERTQEVLGYRPTEFITNPSLWSSLIHPEDIPGVHAQTTKIFTSGQPGLRYYRMKDINGEYRWIEDRVSPEKDKTGRVIKIFGVARDITERKQAEDEIIKLYNAVEQSADIIFITNQNGIIEYVNPAFETITGYSKEEAIGRSPNILSSGLMEPMYNQKLWEIILSGKVYRGEVINRKKDGEVFYYDQTITPLKDARGNIISYVSTGKDVTERKQAEEQINRRIIDLEVLYQSGIGFSQTLDQRDIAEKVIEVLVGHLNWHHAAVRVRRGDSDEVELLAFSPSNDNDLEKIHAQSIITHVGQGMAGWVIEHGQIVRSNNLNNDPRYVETYAGMKSGLYVPLKIRNKTIGCISAESSQPNAFTEDNERITFTLANQAASALENARLFKEIEMAYNATISGWSQAMDLRDKETEGHTQRVAKMTLQLAQAMGLGEAEMLHIQRGALLHDIGKMGVPDGILLKSDNLTDEEWTLMKQHPQFAFDMLSPIAYLKPALDIPYCHHEKWDGSGYPRGLKGEEIPLAARLFAMVDVYDALTSDRPYRKGWSKEKTLKHIRAQSGSHFDPGLVDLFLENLTLEGQ